MSNTSTTTNATDSSTNTKGKRSKKEVPADLAKLQSAEKEYALFCELDGRPAQDVRILLLNPTIAALYASEGTFLLPAQRASIAGESERRERVRATIELAGAARVGENLNAALAAAAPDGAEQVPARFATLPIPMVAVIGDRTVFGTLTAVDSTRGRTGGMVPEIAPHGGGEAVRVDARDRNVSDFRVASIDDVMEHVKPAKRSHRQSAAAE